MGMEREEEETGIRISQTTTLLNLYLNSNHRTMVEE